MKEKVLITGGSGLVGSRLTSLLLDQDVDVVHLGRHQRKGKVRTYGWNPASGQIDEAALDGVTAIVNLAGANVGDGRWTKAKKKEILESRIKSADTLYKALERKRGDVKTLLSASAVGYYGSGTGFTEDSPSGTDFLASICREWEAHVNDIGVLGLRVCIARIGVVLSKNSGALAEMTTPVRYGVGTPLGTGNQSVGWIHIDDLCRAFLHMMANNVSGPYNVASPHPVTNRELTMAIAATLHKPLWLPSVPAIALKLLFGEMSTIVLDDCCVSVDKLLATGFRFQFPEIRPALNDLLVVR